MRAKRSAMHLRRRFPTIFAASMRFGIDPRQTPLPVVAAAHYHMGGIAVDLQGRTNVDGLYACGEVAATGAHGANRLASNSLLESVVYPERIARDIKGRRAASRRRAHRRRDEAHLAAERYCADMACLALGDVCERRRRA